MHMLQLRRTKTGLKVAAAGQAQLAIDRDADMAEKRAAISRAVKRILSTCEFIGRSAVVNLPTCEMDIHSIRMPAMPDDELAKALRFEVQERFDTDISTTEIGFVRLGELRQGDELKHEIILMLAPHRITINYLDALIAAGLRPKAVDASFNACARCFNRTYRRRSDQNKVRMVLNVCHETTDVLILRGSRIGFYRAVNIGGRHLDEAVADHLGLGITEAAELRRRRMKGDEQADSSIDRALREATRPLIVDLAHEAALCQRYYSVTFRGNVPGEVFLTGQQAHEPNLQPVVGDELKVRTQVGKPLEHVDVSSAFIKADRRSNFAEWAVAVGLCLKGQKGLQSSGNSDVKHQDAESSRRAA
ncbi:MAG TPA: hypothetical protein ENJ06_05330 [Phycisphaeraceae bacterium]|nr:hypothetical protein [Phycisphaeraceae bacterium]